MNKYSAYMYGEGGEYIAYDDNQNVIASSSTDAGTVANSLLAAIGTNSWASMKGTFLYKTPILMQDWKNLDCFNSYHTLDADISHLIGDDGVQTYHSKLRGGIWNGNKSVRTSGSCIEGNFKNSDFTRMEIIAFEEFAAELTGTGGTPANGNTWERCIIGALNGAGKSNSDGGIKIGDFASDNNLFLNWYINNGDFQVMVGDNSHKTNIIGGHIAGYAEVGDTKCRGITAIGDADDIHIIGVQMEQIQYEAIFLHPQAGDFLDGTLITGNLFIDAGRDADNTYDGIYMKTNLGQCRYGSVYGNKWQKTQANDLRYCVNLEAPNANFWIITPNVMPSSTWQTAAIFDGGAGNITAPNIVA